MLTKLTAFIDAIKYRLWGWLLMLIIGFFLGQAYTINSITVDCKVLGMFRVDMYGVDCRISKVPA